MLCPQCGMMAKVENVRGRDEEHTVRRYVCRPCGRVYWTAEKITLKAKLTPRDSLYRCKDGK
jgi:transcriptional regulator NrdR family protein